MAFIRDSAKTAIVALVLMAVFLFVALSRHFEKATTPSTLGDFVHVDIRKLLSVVAFGLIGLAMAYWRRRGEKDVLPVALIVAGYSALIEIAQWLHGEREGLYWNTIDTLCGYIGGFFGAWTYVLIERLRCGKTDRVT